jgi:non-heme chloroperoxidase
MYGEAVSPRLPRGFRCIAPDRRGHGRSHTPNIGYDLNTLAYDVATVIELPDLDELV